LAKPIKKYEVEIKISTIIYLEVVYHKENKITNLIISFFNKKILIQICWNLLTKQAKTCYDTKDI